MCYSRVNSALTEEQRLKWTRYRSNLRKAKLFFSDLMYNVRAGSFLKASYEEDAQKTKYFLFINKHYNQNDLKIYIAL